MSLITLHWHSEVLKKGTHAQVLFPDKGTPPFPVLYLLHGVSDDSTHWLRRTRLEVYAATLPLIIVMPDGYRGYYTDNVDGPAYARHIGEELPSQIDRMFATRSVRSGRAIGGISMGGYGALRVGLGFYDEFCSIHSHSGAVGFGTNRPHHETATLLGRDDTFVAEMNRVFGSAPDSAHHHLPTLAGRAYEAGLLPHIRLDCGTEDFLLEDNRTFTSELHRLDIPHEYTEHPGTHGWDYWDTHIRHALDFHMRNLVEQSVVSPDELDAN